jgi:hypothetical protein
LYMMYLNNKVSSSRVKLWGEWLSFWCK